MKKRLRNEFYIYLSIKKSLCSNAQALSFVIKSLNFIILRVIITSQTQERKI